MSFESELRVVTKEDFSTYKNSFDNILDKIQKSNDPNKLNYTPKRFPLDEQEEVTLLLYKNEVVAFSTLFHRDIFPDRVSRALNRMWKDPSIRFLDRPYWVVSRKMLLPQIEAAKSLNKKAIFISVQGERSNWLRRWVSEAKKDIPGWQIASGVRKVANGDDPLCWQHVAYLPLIEHFELELPMKSFAQWEKEYHEFKNL